MVKPWRLTRSAEASLVEIARWTIETFGPRQAAVYEDNLIGACKAIAAGVVQSQMCSQMMDPDLPEALRFTRSGQHFVVYVELDEVMVIVDFLHARSDLPRRIAENLKRLGDSEH